MSNTRAGRPSDRSFNKAVVRGSVSAEVRVSELANGSIVHNFEVRTGVGEDRHVVPVAWHDPVRPPRLGVGDEVLVTGSIRRRWFRTGGGSQSRTELLAEVVARSGSRRESAALGALATWLGSDEVSPR